MIARLNLTMGERCVEASLESTGEWSCDDLLIESYLNSVYGFGIYEGQGSPASGPALARQAAKSVEDAGWAVRCEILQAESDAA